MIAAGIILVILVGVILYARNDFKNDGKAYRINDEWNELNNPK